MKFDFINTVNFFLRKFFECLGRKSWLDEKFQNELTQLIISTSDPEELKNKAAKTIATKLNALRCFIVEYDISTNQFKKITNAYNSKRESKSVLGFDPGANLPSLAIKQKYMNTIVIDDIDKFLKTYNMKNSNEEKYHNEFGVKSSMSVRLEFGEHFLGVIIVQYDVKKRLTNSFEFMFLKKAAELLSLALHLSKLCSKEKAEKEKEKLLRSIISLLSSDYNLEQITMKISEMISSLYDAQKIFIKIDAGEDIKTTYEFSSTSKVNTHEDNRSLEFYNSSEFDVIRNSTYYIENTHNFIMQNNLENSDIDYFFRRKNINSIILLPILHEAKQFGILIIHFNKIKPINIDELIFIKTINEQLAIAVKQSLILEKERRTAQRESLLRAITTAVRNSLDLNETFNIICSEIAKVFSASRASIVEFKKNEQKNILRGEYKLNTQIKGINDVEKETRNNALNLVKNLILEKNSPFIIKDTESRNIPELIREFYNELKTKSIVIIPIKKGRDYWGMISISHIFNYKDWNQEEIELLETIQEQIYLAIKQAELYGKTLAMAKREVLIRTITEKIRSSLDIDKTLTFICDETAKLFQVQRASIVFFPDKKDYMNFELKKEYKLSDELPGFTEISDITKISYFWSENLTVSKKIFAVDNISECDVPDYFKNAYTNMGVKSIMGCAISDNKMKWGDLILSEYNEPRIWSAEEKDLLITISEQIYIAIQQAELFENEKVMLERERISRNIIEILRSSIDKTIIKKLFVKNIGSFFKADRVLFSEYDNKTKTYLAADKDSEYLPNISEASLVGFDWAKPELNEFLQPLLEKRELNIFDLEEYLQQYQKGDNFINFFKEYNIKSSYNFPVLYQGEILGFFCLDYVGSAHKLSDEDISKLRSICTQAGIAMYHAKLYQEAQKCNLQKDTITSELIQKTKPHASNILDLSIKLYENEFERHVQIEYINNIIKSCNQILALTENIN